MKDTEKSCSTCKYFYDKEYMTTGITDCLCEDLTEEELDMYYTDNKPGCPHWVDCYDPKLEKYCEELIFSDPNAPKKVIPKPIYEWEKVVSNKLRSVKLFADVYISFNTYSGDKEEPTLCVEINMGDWKHEHLRCKNLIPELFGFDYIDSCITETTDSDVYSAIHYFRISKDAYTLRELDSQVDISCYIDADKVRSICIKNNWYTMGDVVEYDKMLDYCRKTKEVEGTLDKAVYSVATDIYLHSAMRTDREYSREEHVKNIMSYILNDAIIWLVKDI